MRLGLIGDVHQEDLTLARALCRLEDEGVDLIVCVGDIADGYGDLDACCELLDSHGVLTVKGNHDRWFLSQTMRELPQAAPLAAANELSRDWLAALPATLSVPTPAGVALVCHGTGANDMIGVKPEDEGYALDSNVELQRLLQDDGHAILIAGHTHRPMVRRLGSLTLVNAGTLHRDYEPCVGVLDGETLEARFIQLSRPNPL